MKNDCNGAFEGLFIIFLGAVRKFEKFSIISCSTFSPAFFLHFAQVTLISCIDTGRQNVVNH